MGTSPRDKRGSRTKVDPCHPGGAHTSFIARLRDELLDGNIFYTLKEAQVLIEAWRCHYNAIRPHGSLGYRPPAPETTVTPSWPPGFATLRRPHALTFNPDQSMEAGQGSLRPYQRTTPLLELPARHCPIIDIGER